MPVGVCRYSMNQCHHALKRDRFLTVVLAGYDRFRKPGLGYPYRSWCAELAVDFNHGDYQRKRGLALSFIPRLARYLEEQVDANHRQPIAFQLRLLW